MAHGTSLRKALAEKFDDELKFFKGWIDKPKTVGSIVPTSSIAARRMASVVNPDSGLPVLELGPGTGVITRAILALGVKPENLYSIEYSDDFVRHLTAQFPGVNIIKGDAFNLDATLGDKRGMIFDSVVSGAAAQLSGCAAHPLHRGPAAASRRAGRSCSSPTARCRRCRPERGDYKVEHYDFVLRNIPPTQLWVYRRPA